MSSPVSCLFFSISFKMINALGQAPDQQTGDSPTPNGLMAGSTGESLGSGLGHFTPSPSPPSSTPTQTTC